MFKKKARSFITAALSAVLILSCCGEATERADETTAETTSATTAKTLTDEELDEMAKNMPEIVFVMAISPFSGSNILGSYITNKGDVKLFDFREIEPNEVYDVRDVYDRLEEATCSEVNYDSLPRVLKENDLPDIPNDKMTEYYKMLLQVNEPAAKWESGLDYHVNMDKTMIYGIRNTSSCENEFILLFGKGHDTQYYEYRSSDINANNLSDEIYFNIFIWLQAIKSK